MVIVKEASPRPKAKPDKKQRNITKAVQKLLKNFPPTAKK